MPVACHTLLDFTGLVEHAVVMGATCVLVPRRTLEQQCQLEGQRLGVFAHPCSQLSIALTVISST